MSHNSFDMCNHDETFHVYPVLDDSFLRGCEPSISLNCHLGKNCDGAGGVVMTILYHIIQELVGVPGSFRK